MKTGTNLPKVRDYNEQVVLELIRINGGTSRVEIAERTGLTAQTASNIVRRLLAKDLIVEGDKAVSKDSGKPRVGLEINPGAGYALGVQIDCNDISLVTMDLAGNVIATSERRTLQERGPDGIIEDVARLVEDSLLETVLDPEKVLGLGVCCPGPLDHQTGVVYDPPNLWGWEEVPLKERLEQKTGLPVLIDNDATASAIGERWSGGAQGVQDFAFIYVGVGIGAGLFVGNQLLRGSSSNAGEFGHTTVNVHGPECFCGRRGCVEVYCAPGSVASRVMTRLDQGEESVLSHMVREDLTFREVGEAALAGDTLSREEVEYSSELLGQGVVNLVNTLDLELVVLGGRGLGQAAGIYAEKIEKVLRATTLARELREVRVELSAHGVNAGPVGAAASILHTTYNPQMRDIEAG